MYQFRSSLLLVFLCVVCGYVAAVHGQSGVEASHSTVEQVVEFWRWKGYWLGEFSVASKYREGDMITALVFKAKRDFIPAVGMCVEEWSICIALPSPNHSASEYVMTFTPGVEPATAARAFVDSQFGGTEQAKVKLDDYDLTTLRLVAPPLGPPRSVERKYALREEVDEAQHVARNITCGGGRSPNSDCRGRVQFARHEQGEPYWFVCRECSPGCQLEGKSIIHLRKGDFGTWVVTAAGLVDHPKSSVDRFEALIRDAMLAEFLIH